MVDRSAVNDYVVENTGQADHPSAGGSDLQAVERNHIPGIWPLEGDYTVLMVPGGAQGTTVVQVIELEDQSIGWVSILLWLIAVHRLSDCLLRGAGGQNGIADCGKSHLCKEAQGLPLGTAAQVVADQVKGHERKPALPHLLRIQLSDTARGKVPRVRIWLFQGAVKGVKLLPTDNPFPPNFKRFRTRDNQRNIFHDAHRVGNILALNAITPGNSL